MKAQILSVAIFLACATVCSLMFFGTTTPHAVNRYGTKVVYGDKSTSRYPDFTIKFLTEREVKVPAYGGTFFYYDFIVVKDDAKKIVTWSSGTGDIGPIYFAIGGEDFVLELEASDVLKEELYEGEMVIWKRKEFEKLNGKRDNSERKISQTFSRPRL